MPLLIQKVWFRVISNFPLMHKEDGLGSVCAPTSVWSIDYGKNETIARMRCFLATGCIWWINLIGDNEAYDRLRFH